MFPPLASAFAAALLKPVSGAGAGTGAGAGSRVIVMVYVVVETPSWAVMTTVMTFSPTARGRAAVAAPLVVGTPLTVIFAPDCVATGMTVVEVVEFGTVAVYAVTVELKAGLSGTPAPRVRLDRVASALGTE
jgi:hypothetical protein